MGMGGTPVTAGWVERLKEDFTLSSEKSRSYRERFVDVRGTRKRSHAWGGKGPFSSGLPVP